MQRLQKRKEELLAALGSGIDDFNLSPSTGPLPTPPISGEGEITPADIAASMGLNSGLGDTAYPFDLTLKGCI